MKWAIKAPRSAGEASLYLSEATHAGEEERRGGEDSSRPSPWTPPGDPDPDPGDPGPPGEPGVVHRLTSHRLQRRF